MHPTVLAAARDLHVARARLTTLRTAVDTAEKLMREQFSGVYAELADAKERAGKAEDFLRSLAEAVYAEDPSNVEPAPGVTVKPVVFLRYDEQKAFEWAKRTGLALTFDKAAFEKIVSASPSSFVDFVGLASKPKASIAKDLTPAAAEFNKTPVAAMLSTAEPAVVQAPAPFIPEEPNNG
jgi:hypothetical protein